MPQPGSAPQRCTETRAFYGEGCFMVLVERQEALGLLTTALTSCIGGAGLAIAVNGPVGGGKTELLRQFAQQALESDATFLNATASRTERASPLGVTSQLFTGAMLSVEQTERAGRLIEDGMLTAAVLDGSDNATYVSGCLSGVFSALTEILLESALDRPLLVAVDDAHFADIASLQFLLYLVRRIGNARILVVLCEALRPAPGYAVFRADLTSQFNCRQVGLKLLSVRGAAAVLSQRIPRGERLAAAFHRVSGGNPMLLNALILDHQQLAAGSDPNGEAAAPLAGEAFGQAVLSCLYRSTGHLLRLVQVIAVLDTPAPVALISELLGFDADSTVRAISAAIEIGLLRDHQQLRHARARAAVLDAMTVAERAALHERAASVLRATGASPAVVARHVIAANVADPTRFVPTLMAAAVNALESDDAALALACCRMAEGAQGGTQSRLHVRALRVQVQWRVDPTSACHTIGELSKAARAGQLTAQDALPLIGYLLWCGQPSEAMELLERLDAAAADAGDEDTAAGLYFSGCRPAICTRAWSPGWGHSGPGRASMPCRPGAACSSRWPWSSRRCSPAVRPPMSAPRHSTSSRPIGSTRPRRR
ncbi:AAA family ATPase [Paractinoplanes durhamensis]|uniref:AAA family ATPase n=1 Tax=Paractinoplanes durhamensis TaxID=113563 RepID=UPI00363295B5